MGAQLLTSCASSADRAQKLVERWRSGDAPVYLMGKNGITKIVNDYARRHGLAVQGLIASDFQGESWEGVPRRDLKEVPVDAIVINCVPDGRTITINKQIRRANLIPLTYFELSAWSATDFPLEFVAPPFAAADEARLQSVMDRLDDEYSRDTFARVLQFRSSLDVSPLAVFPFDIANQYVESFLTPLGYRHLVDGGVYDGKNTLTLLEAYPTLRSATLFEPNLAMHATIRERLSGRDYELVGKGLWHSSGQLRFNANAGSASGIDENGSQVIDVTRLDDHDLPEGTWIKLDLEGAEVAALQGAAETIRRKRPSLAIATYHDNRHFYEIPELVFGLRSDYRLKVRHYTEGRLETIYYFL